MGFISNLFGGGDEEESAPTQTTNQTNGFSNWWMNGRGGAGGDAFSQPQSYLSNFVYGNNQNGQSGYDSGSVDNLLKGLVNSQYNTVSGYQPLSYVNYGQPRAGLYSLADLNRGM